MPLTDTELQQFQEDGFLIVRDFFRPEQLAPVIEWVDQLVNDKGSMLLINQLIPHRSTENLADIIRWSVDLRWQRPDQQSGFEGIKDCILMRTAADARYRIDWSAWAEQNRIADAMDQPRRGDLDTTVTGPWLKRWAAGS